MEKQIMECGHAANSMETLSSGQTRPACVICAGLHPGYATPKNDQPNLKGRRAKCTCGYTTESSMGLAFFEYKPDNEFDTFYCGCYGWN